MRGSAKARPEKKRYLWARRRFSDALSALVKIFNGSLGLRFASAQAVVRSHLRRLIHCALTRSLSRQVTRQSTMFLIFGKDYWARVLLGLGILTAKIYSRSRLPKRTLVIDRIGEICVQSLDCREWRASAYIGPQALASEYADQFDPYFS